MKQESPTLEVEPLITASFLDRKGVLRKSAAYRLAQRGAIPSYMVGEGQTGVRFRLSEVLNALRRQVK